MDPILIKKVELGVNKKKRWREEKGKGHIVDP